MSGLPTPPMGEGLPSSWVACSLGDVVDYGATTKVEPQEIPEDAWVLELEDIEKDTSVILERPTFKERQSRSTKNKFQTGDVLYGKLRPYLNKVVRADQDGYCTTEIIPLRSSQYLDGGYLFHWMKSPGFLDYVKNSSHGMSMPRLGTEAGKVAPFILAPIAEQKRIADKLDAVLARVDACRERLEKVPIALQRFRQSVLAAACDGRLTEDWREKSQDKYGASDLLELIHNAHIHAGGHRAGNAAAPTENIHNLCVEMFPNGWSLTTLKQLVRPDRPITYGILKPGPEVNGGIPYIRVADFPNDRLSLDEIRHTDPSIDFAFRRSRLEAGDLLLSIRGTVGRLIVIPPDLEGANITQDSARLSIQSAIERDYVLWFLRSEMAQSRIRGAVKGVAVRGINIGDVRALQVPLPPLAEQKEIVRRIENLLRLADQIEDRYTKASGKVDRLIQAILAKAFRGELVPQDPNDEPAEALLARIRAERGATQEPARRRGRPPALRPEAAPEVAAPRPPRPAALPTAPAEPEAEPATRVDLEALDTDTVMAAFRQALSSQARWFDDLDLLRAVAARYGYQRLGSRVKDVLKGHLRAALLRGIALRREEDGTLTLGPRSLDEYPRDALVDAIPGVLRKGQAMDREDLMRALLDHLGFHRLTDPAREALRSTLNAAIRRGVLEAEGPDRVRRVS